MQPNYTVILVLNLFYKNSTRNIFKNRNKNIITSDRRTSSFSLRRAVWVGCGAPKSNGPRRKLLQDCKRHTINEFRFFFVCNFENSEKKQFTLWEKCEPLWAKCERHCDTGFITRFTRDQARRKHQIASGYKQLVWTDKNFLILM